MRRHKRSRSGLRFLALGLLLAAGCLYSPAPKVATQGLALEPLPGRFEQPLFVTYAPSLPDTLFVVEKTGRIQVVQGGQIQPVPLLDLRGQVSQGSEQGLLGLAFHPGFAENGLFFVNYTDRAGDTQIVRYRVAPGTLTADPASRTVILSIRQPRSNHNGGMIAFGPDGYLYIGTGDGGGAGDPERNAQNGATLLGKMLRIDVDRGEPYAVPPDNPFAGDPSVRHEIWALGLRNPWRFSFDRLTGDLYIADVGQNQWEEVNVQPAASRGGENYGWNVMEGTHCYPSGQCSSAGFVLPVIEYAHQATGGCSVTGGYVYRGEAIPWLYGRYVFGDYCSGQIWAAQPGPAGAPWTVTLLLDTDALISSFGEDAAGELYAVDLRGTVYRLVAADLRQP